MPARNNIGAAKAADKLLIDVAKQMGTYLELDWELYIKDEYHKEFFRDYRQTYNYFKHADTDFHDSPVRAPRSAASRARDPRLALCRAPVGLSSTCLGSSCERFNCEVNI